MLVARPIPKWFRKQFVDPKTNHLSNKFFYKSNGTPRKPFQEALDETDVLLHGNQCPVAMSFTPFMVQCYVVELVARDWACQNSADAWRIIYQFGDQPSLAFYCAQDAVHYRLSI